MEGPVPFITVDQNSQQFQVGSKSLELLASITKPIRVIAVVGQLRGGKSTLMNLLLGLRTGHGGFTAAKGLDSTTKGVHMYIKELPQIVEIYLDTEGLKDTEQRFPDFDAKVFAIITMLSSLILYNFSGCISVPVFQYLDLALETARFIEPPHLDRALATATFVPAILFVLRDAGEVTVDGKPATDAQYLETKLRDDPESAATATGVLKTRIRTWFHSRDLVSLPPPFEDRNPARIVTDQAAEALSDEFRDRVQRVREVIQKRARPMTSSNGEATVITQLNGSSYAALVKHVVDTMNVEGKKLVFQDIFESITGHTARAVCQEIIASYKIACDAIRETLPLNDFDLDRALGSEKSIGLDRLKREVVENGVPGLTDEMTSVFEKEVEFQELSMRVDNTAKSTAACAAILSEYSEKFLEISSLDAFDRQADVLLVEIKSKSRGPEAITKGLLDGILAKRDVQRARLEAILEEEVTGICKAIIMKFKLQLADLVRTLPLDMKDLDQAFGAIKSIASQSLKSEVEGKSVPGLSERIMLLLENDCPSERSMVDQRNGEKSTEACESLAQECQRNLLALETLASFDRESPTIVHKAYEHAKGPAKSPEFLLRLQKEASEKRKHLEEVLANQFVHKAAALVKQAQNKWKKELTQIKLEQTMAPQDLEEKLDKQKSNSTKALSIGINSLECAIGVAKILDEFKAECGSDIDECMKLNKLSLEVQQSKVLELLRKEMQDVPYEKFEQEYEALKARLLTPAVLSLGAGAWSNGQKQFREEKDRLQADAKKRHDADVGYKNLQASDVTNKVRADLLSRLDVLRDNLDQIDSSSLDKQLKDLSDVSMRQLNSDLTSLALSPDLIKQKVALLTDVFEQRATQLSQRKDVESVIGAVVSELTTLSLKDFDTAFEALKANALSKVHASFKPDVGRRIDQRKNSTLEKLQFKAEQQEHEVRTEYNRILETFEETVRDLAMDEWGGDDVPRIISFAKEKALASVQRIVCQGASISTPQRLRENAESEMLKLIRQPMEHAKAKILCTRFSDKLSSLPLPMDVNQLSRIVSSAEDSLIEELRRFDMYNDSDRWSAIKSDISNNAGNTKALNAGLNIVQVYEEQLKQLCRAPAPAHAIHSYLQQRYQTCAQALGQIHFPGPQGTRSRQSINSVMESVKNDYEPKCIQAATSPPPPAAPGFIVSVAGQGNYGGYGGYGGNGDGRCGHPTTKGGRCRNYANSCPWH
ncbi:hypothetical protein HKX48_001174 [Thoreauomyces humboldtii]|nr:hypothetical protein HKX48_001174 [Thoreauomyces humboldtii]